MKYFYYLSVFACLFCSCNYKKAKEVIQEQDALYYYNEGVTCHYKDDYKGALANYEKAISLDSTVSDFFLNRGSIKHSLGDTIGALDDYIKTIQLDTFNAIAYYNIGCLISDAGKDSIAIEYYNLAKRIDPEYYPAYYNCARSQYKLKDYKNALKNFEVSLQYPADQDYVYYYIGLIYKETGDIDKAIEYLDKAKSLGNKKAEEELKKME